MDVAAWKGLVYGALQANDDRLGGCSPAALALVYMEWPCGVLMVSELTRTHDECLLDAPPYAVVDARSDIATFECR